MNIDRELGENEYINPEDGLIYCSICRRPKERIMYFLDEYRHVPVICKCREEEKEQERLEEERRERMHRIERLRFLGMQDKKLREYTFDNDKGFCPDLYKARNYVDNFAELSRSGRGLILCGPPGTGKTYFAACIANALIEQEISVYMTNFSTLINRLTGVFSEDKNTIISDVTGRDLLVIDDLGIERNTEFALEQVYNVIDARYRSGKPMIVTTNISLYDLQNPGDLIHKRIFDRVLEVCAPIMLNGMNIRKINMKENNEIVGKIINTISEGMVKKNE